LKNPGRGAPDEKLVREKSRAEPDDFSGESKQRRSSRRFITRPSPLVARRKRVALALREPDDFRAMDTKECRHCRQLIAAKARLCQHCHGYQSWTANQRDPRYWVIWPVMLIAVFGAFAFAMPLAFDRGERRSDPPQLSVSGVSSRIVPAPDGQRIFVVGRVDNASARDGAKIWFRVNLYDASNRLADTFLGESYGLIAPAQGGAMFRVIAPTSVSQDDVKRIEVVVERARSRDKWD
jgi:hypothetical protein